MNEDLEEISESSKAPLQGSLWVRLKAKRRKGLCGGIRLSKKPKNGTGIAK